MRVYEVAREFKIDPEKLTQLLRSMGVAVRSEATAVDDATVAKLRARFERERRAGHGEAEEAISTVIEDAQPVKRRRRKKEDLPPAPEPEPVIEAAPQVVEPEPVLAPLEKVEKKSPFLEDLPPQPKEEIAAEAVPQVESEAPAPPPASVTPPKREITEEQKPKLRRAAEVLGWTTPRTQPQQQQPQRPTQQRQQRQGQQQPAASAGPGGHVRIQAEGFTSDGRKQASGAGAAGTKPPQQGGKPDKKKKKQRKVDQEEVQENINRVLAELKGSGKKKKHRREEAPSRVELEAERQRKAVEEATIVRVNEFLTVAELAELIDKSPTEIVGSAFKNLGLMVTINQRLDFDQIELLLDEFGFRAVKESEYAADVTDAQEEEDKPEDLKPRPPVVTVMGHVDHGKTSLLDYIRKTNVIAGESGGITQHIGAYHVKLDDARSITFLDTPGHAAFTAMRARGAEVTDLVILVVAADDSVMPQTIEAISHAKNAGVPMIVAINKVDLPAANASRVKQELLQHGVVVEDFGGDVMSAEVSAKKGNGVDDLLEKVLLQAEVLDLKANPSRTANGVVVEALLDVGKGPVATVLVTNGTLHVGDSFVCGHFDGRVRALLDERGNIVKNAGPGTPVQVLGMPGVPQAGDVLLVMDAIKAAEIAQTRSRLDREKQLRVKSRGVKLTDISKLLAQGQTAYLNLIIKGDVDGSVQALSDALAQLSTSEVQVDVIHRGVGAINESDVLLAATSGAIIIGFHVRPTAEARAVAAREGVDIRPYNIIYEAIEEVRAALEGMLSPEEKEVLLGVAEVRELFKVPKIGVIAGCQVREGVIDRKGRVRVVRDGLQVYDGEIGSLKRFKDDVKEVREGYECGIGVHNFNDLKVGDTIECYKVESVARLLVNSAAAE
ncbi:MAG TPA: translation initiation factor IF-2 [Longimicrobiales bacterium]|nr:translation initiation factor IF-2 [Longimicrobiales bacterium]